MKSLLKNNWSRIAWLRCEFCERREGPPLSWLRLFVITPPFFSLLHPILAELADNLTALTNHQHFPPLLSEYHPWAEHCALEFSQYEFCLVEEYIDSIVTRDTWYYITLLQYQECSSQRESDYIYPAPSWSYLIILDPTISGEAGPMVVVLVVDRRPIFI